MKHRLFLGIAFSLLLPAACRDGPIRPSYRPVLPELPGHWKENFGEPHWRIEWLGEGAKWQERSISPAGRVPSLSLIQEWTTPVIAWPFWPDHGLVPGMMRPCGALFPWDVSGDEIALGWEAGVEAVFWKEMASAERTTAAGEGRLPWYFDWPRFRAALGGAETPEDVRRDLWLPDWKGIAQKTVDSGYDRRRIVSRKFLTLAIPGFGGQWTGSSPFEPPLDAGEDGLLSLKVWEIPDTWVSEEGILKCSASGWVFIPHSK